jgi:hypothetical protein
MGNCCTAANDVKVLNDMLHHLGEQIEEMKGQVTKNGDEDTGVAIGLQRDIQWKKLIDMEHERELLKACVVQAMEERRSRYGGCVRRRWMETAIQNAHKKPAKRSTKWIPQIQKRKRAGWNKKSKPNGRNCRLPAYICMLPETTNHNNDMDDSGSDTSYFSAVSHLDDDATSSIASYDIPDIANGHGFYPWWTTDFLASFWQTPASRLPRTATTCESVII